MITVNAQWTNTGDNTTTGKVTSSQLTFPRVGYDFSKMPRAQISPMSIKLFDDYVTTRPGGNSPDNNSYGTLLSINGRANHWESNIYFGANTKKMYFRTSNWSGGNNENGIKGGFHDWRTLLDSKSDIKTSGLLKIEGNGSHYISRGNFGIGTSDPKNYLHVKGGENSYSQVLIEGGSGAAIQLESKNNTGDRPVISAKDGDLSFQIWKNRGNWRSSPFIIKTDGNIGIGTTTPTQKLEVESGNTNGTNPPVIRLSSKDVNAINNQLLGEIQFYNGDADGKHVSSFIKSLAAERYGRKGKLTFGTSGTNSKDAIERMRIDENGKVGIGTTSPKEVLTVSKNGATIGIYDTNPRSKANNRIARYSNSLVIQNDLNGAWTDNVNFNDNGNVGIGTTSPTRKLDVNGHAKIRGSLILNQTTSDYTDIQLGHDTNDRIFSDNSTAKHYGGGMFFRVTPDPSLNITHNYIDVMMLTDKGNVGIGTSDTKGYKLAIAGSKGVIAEEVTVKLQSNWPDYVFTEDYKLPTLIEVEKQIKDKGHLANIPSAKEVEKNGVKLGEMNKKLLEKIEELTLYTIQQEKEIQKLKSQQEHLKEVKKENRELKNRLDKIEELLRNKKF